MEEKEKLPKLTDYLKVMCSIASIGEVIPRCLDTSSNNDFKKPCLKCNGLGYDEESANDDGEVEECSICKGTGRAS